MVQAIINISEDTNRTLNMLKAKHSLKDKSAAINFLAKQYQDDEEEPELKPSYIRKLNRLAKEKPIFVGTVENLRKLIERK